MNKRPPELPHKFMFATGIENSCPVITAKDGRNKRVDEMESCGHYQNWRHDFELVRELGIQFLRCGPAYYRTHLGPGRFDWEFTDESFAGLRRMDLTPIADLCHFGVPDWLGDFQNPDFPRHFAEYAGAFARRFPWVHLYTPVNEIFVNATFSAQFGWWNERLTSDKAFVTALRNLARANLLAEKEILEVRPDAIFIQSEATQYFHAGKVGAEAIAENFNEKRFLSFDLSYGYDVRGCMYEYLMDNGMTREDYHWFMDSGKAMRLHCVMGNDYYITNEHLVQADGSLRDSGEIFGYYVITKDYYERYRLPVMHTETNLQDGERAPEWLWKEWANMLYLRRQGVPVIGFTWYSLLDQIDWDTALREDNGNVNPLGLFDLDRKIRPVGKEYKKLIQEWSDLVPRPGPWVRGDMAALNRDSRQLAEINSHKYRS
jgi:beta-glucosidase/6-phospho-beta-glucosidase/beta-galactosidase